MSAVSAAPPSPDFSGLNPQIVEKIEPFKEIADEVRFHILCSEDSADDFVRSVETDSTVHKVNDFSGVLRGFNSFAKEFMYTMSDSKNKATFKVTVTVLQGENVLKKLQHTKK